MAVDGLSYFAYDFLTGTYLLEVPVRSPSFTRVLNSSGQLTGSVDLADPRINAASVIQATLPNRSVIVADWKGIPIWAGVSQPRKWDVEASSGSATGVLSLTYNSIWAYFQQRIQATDYSSPPFSGISGEAPMRLWTAAPWFAPLIAAQVMEDALVVPFGNPLGGTALTLNGRAPEAQLGLEVPAGDLVAVNYPYPSLATVDSIVDSLAKLGLGVGFDFAYEVLYSAGPRSNLKGRFEIDWPWRGASEDTAGLNPRWSCDLVRARKYNFTEDGTQTAWQAYEVGGGGAIYVDSNVAPPGLGYPLLERVLSRSSISSPDIMGLLKLNGDSDLSLYSFAPTTATVTVGIEDPMLPLGRYEVGDLMVLRLPKGYDPRFPDGYEGTWRLTSYKVDAKDEGDATVELTFAQPTLYMSEVTLPKLP